MNYAALNKAIMSGKDVPDKCKDARFYEYLLANNVAYFYATNIAKHAGPHEKRIIQAGDLLNQKYLSTLALVSRLSGKHSIPILLFKTWKYVEEVVDGDIDLIVHKKDFHAFVDLLISCGFSCIVEPGDKASCTKKGLSKIEPRTTISAHGETLFSESEIWRHTKYLSVGSIQIMKPSDRLEAAYFLLNMLYGPNYIRLYHMLVFRCVNMNRLDSLTKRKDIQEDIRLMQKIMSEKDIVHRRFPLFIPNGMFIRWWFRRFLFHPVIHPYLRVKNLLFFLYAKYGFVLFGRLPFRHDWGVRYG